MIIIDRPMPKTCGECPCLNHNLHYCQALTDKTWKVPQVMMARPKWCPLREGKKYDKLDT